MTMAINILGIRDGFRLCVTNLLFRSDRGYRLGLLHCWGLTLSLARA